MAKRFEYYYLQLNAGSAWETVEQSDSVAALTSGLADHLASPPDAAIRLVGANFDEPSQSWAYEQLFYIDQSSIDLGISEEPDEAGMPFAGAADDTDPDGMAQMEERHAPADDPYDDDVTNDDGTSDDIANDDMADQEARASQGEASDLDDDPTAAGQDGEDEAPPQEYLDDPLDDPGRSDTGLSLERDDDDLDETAPWMRSRAADDDDDETLELAEPYPFDPPPR
ncbi:MAG: hypothetical protein O2985_11735, partial [Proteobacteria bacterium]|nr:hypothetical protein [Pseudomonadota bacterium]